MSAMLPVPLATALSDKQMRERAELKDRIVQAIHKVDDPVWGSAGDFDSANVRVERHHLWANPIYEITFTQDEIDGVWQSLKAQGQRKPIVVANYPDPRPLDQDGTGARYLIVDLDGQLTWKASFRVRGLESLLVRFVDYPDLYRLSVDTMVLASTAHETSNDDYALLFLRARHIHDLLSQQGVSLPEWPKQAEWAARLGKSQSTVSRWEQMADMLKSAIVRNALDEGRVTITQLREVVDLPVYEREPAVREVVAANAARGASGPLSQRQTRDTVKRHRSGVQSINDSDFMMELERPEAGALCIPELAELEPFVAFSFLLHDLSVYHDLITNAVTAPSPAMKRIAALLSAPEVQRLLQDLEDA